MSLNIDRDSILIFLLSCLDFTCPTDEALETIAIGAGDTFAFNTNEGRKYSKNMHCQVDYIMETSCEKIKLLCRRFTLATGDFLVVRKGKAKPVK